MCRVRTRPVSSRSTARFTRYARSTTAAASWIHDSRLRFARVPKDMSIAPPSDATLGVETPASELLGRSTPILVTTLLLPAGGGLSPRGTGGVSTSRPASTTSHRVVSETRHRGTTERPRRDSPHLALPEAVSTISLGQRAGLWAAALATREAALAAAMSPWNQPRRDCRRHQNATRLTGRDLGAQGLGANLSTTAGHHDKTGKRRPSHLCHVGNRGPPKP